MGRWRGEEKRREVNGALELIRLLGRFWGWEEVGFVRYDSRGGRAYWARQMLMDIREGRIKSCAE